MRSGGPQHAFIAPLHGGPGHATSTRPQQQQRDNSHAEERRRDGASYYTRAEFLSFYGGTAEWDAAAPESMPLGPQQPAQREAVATNPPMNTDEPKSSLSPSAASATEQRPAANSVRHNSLANLQRLRKSSGAGMGSVLDRAKKAAADAGSEDCDSAEKEEEIGLTRSIDATHISLAACGVDQDQTSILNVKQALAKEAALLNAQADQARAARNAARSQLKALEVARHHLPADLEAEAKREETKACQRGVNAFGRDEDALQVAAAQVGKAPPSSDSVRALASLTLALKHKSTISIEQLTERTQIGVKDRSKQMAAAAEAHKAINYETRVKRKAFRRQQMQSRRAAARASLTAARQVSELADKSLDRLHESSMLGDNRTTSTLNSAKKAAEGAAQAIQETSAALWREELEREQRDVACGLMRRFRRASAAPQAPRTLELRKRTLRSAILALGGDLPRDDSTDAGRSEKMLYEKNTNDSDTDSKGRNSNDIQDKTDNEPASKGHSTVDSLDKVLSWRSAPLHESAWIEGPEVDGGHRYYYHTQYLQCSWYAPLKYVPYGGDRSMLAAEVIQVHMRVWLARLAVKRESELQAQARANAARATVDAVSARAIQASRACEKALTAQTIAREEEQVLMKARRRLAERWGSLWQPPSLKRAWQNVRARVWRGGALNVPVPSLLASLSMTTPHTFAMATAWLTRLRLLPAPSSSAEASITDGIQSSCQDLLADQHLGGDQCARSHKNTLEHRQSAQYSPRKLAAAAASLQTASDRDFEGAGQEHQGGEPGPADCSGATGWGGSLSAHLGVAVPLALLFDFTRLFRQLLFVLSLLYTLPVALLCLGGLGIEPADADPLGFAFTTLGNLGLSDELRADGLAVATGTSPLAFKAMVAAQRAANGSAAALYSTSFKVGPSGWANQGWNVPFGNGSAGTEPLAVPSWALVSTISILDFLVILGCMMQFHAWKIIAHTASGNRQDVTLPPSRQARRARGAANSGSCCRACGCPCGCTFRFGCTCDRDPALHARNGAYYSDQRVGNVAGESNASVEGPSRGRWFNRKPWLEKPQLSAGGTGTGQLSANDYAIWVRGLPYDATEESVRAFFSKQGDLSRPHRPMKLVFGCFGGREDDADSESTTVNSKRTLLRYCSCVRGKQGKVNKEDDTISADHEGSGSTSSSSSGLDEDCSEGDATDDDSDSGSHSGSNSGSGFESASPSESESTDSEGSGGVASEGRKLRATQSGKGRNPKAANNRKLRKIVQRRKAYRQSVARLLPGFSAANLIRNSEASSSVVGSSSAVADDNNENNDEIAQGEGEVEARTTKGAVGQQPVRRLQHVGGDIRYRGSWVAEAVVITGCALQSQMQWHLQMASMAHRLRLAEAALHRCVARQRARTLAAKRAAESSRAAVKDRLDPIVRRTVNDAVKLLRPALGAIMKSNAAIMTEPRNSDRASNDNSGEGKDAADVSEHHDDSEDDDNDVELQDSGDADQYDTSNAPDEQSDIAIAAALLALGKAKAALERLKRKQAESAAAQRSLERSAALARHTIDENEEGGAVAAASSVMDLMRAGVGGHGSSASRGAKRKRVSAKALGMPAPSCTGDAFVIFEHPESRRRVLTDYRASRPWFGTSIFGDGVTCFDGNEKAPWCGYWIGPFPLPGWLGRFFQPRKLRFADLRGKRHTLSVVAAPSPEDIRWHRAADWASPAGGSMGAAVASGCGACGAAIFSALEPLRQICVGVLGLSMGSGVSRSSSRWRRACGGGALIAAVSARLLSLLFCALSFFVALSAHGAAAAAHRRIAAAPSSRAPEVAALCASMPALWHGQVPPLTSDSTYNGTVPPPPGSVALRPPPIDNVCSSGMHAIADTQSSDTIIAATWNVTSRVHSDPSGKARSNLCSSAAAKSSLGIIWGAYGQTPNTMSWHFTNSNVVSSGVSSTLTQDCTTALHTEYADRTSNATECVRSCRHPFDPFSPATSVDSDVLLSSLDAKFSSLENPVPTKLSSAGMCGTLSCEVPQLARAPFNALLPGGIGSAQQGSGLSGAGAPCRRFNDLAPVACTCRAALRRAAQRNDSKIWSVSSRLFSGGTLSAAASLSAADKPLCGKYASAAKVAQVLSLFAAFVGALMPLALRPVLRVTIEREAHATIAAGYANRFCLQLFSHLACLLVAPIVAHSPWSPFGTGTDATQLAVVPRFVARIFGADLSAQNGGGGGGDVTDLDRRWYTRVGTAILLSLLINVLLPAIAYFLRLATRRVRLSVALCWRLSDVEREASLRESVVHRAALIAARSAATSATQKAKQWTTRRVRLPITDKKANNTPQDAWLSSRVQTTVNQAKISVEHTLVSAVKDIVPAAVQHATAFDNENTRNAQQRRCAIFGAITGRTYKIMSFLHKATVYASSQSLEGGENEAIFARENVDAGLADAEHGFVSARDAEDALGRLSSMRTNSDTVQSGTSYASPDSFDMVGSFSHVVATTMAGIIIAAPLPCALPISALALCVAYVVDRHAVLHTMPPPQAIHTHEARALLARIVSSVMLPITLLMHVSIAVWCFGAPDNFATLSADVISSFVEAVTKDQDHDNVANFTSLLVPSAIASAQEISKWSNAATMNVNAATVATGGGITFVAINGAQIGSWAVESLRETTLLPTWALDRLWMKAIRAYRALQRERDCALKSIGRPRNQCLISANADRLANELKPARPAESAIGRAATNDPTAAMMMENEAGNKAQLSESAAKYGILWRSLHTHVFLPAVVLVVLIFKMVLNTRPAQWIMDTVYPIITFMLSIVSALLIFLSRKVATQLPCQGDAAFACMRRCRAARTRRARRRRRFARARRREQLSLVRADVRRDAEMVESGNAIKTGHRKQILPRFSRLWHQITCAEKRLERKRAKIMGYKTSNAAVRRREDRDERRLHRALRKYRATFGSYPQLPDPAPAPPFSAPFALLRPAPCVNMEASILSSTGTSGFFDCKAHADLFRARELAAIEKLEGKNLSLRGLRATEVSAGWRYEARFGAEVKDRVAMFVLRRDWPHGRAHLQNAGCEDGAARASMLSAAHIRKDKNAQAMWSDKAVFSSHGVPRLLTTRPEAARRRWHASGVRTAAGDGSDPDERGLKNYSHALAFPASVTFHEEKEAELAAERKRRAEQKAVEVIVEDEGNQKADMSNKKKSEAEDVDEKLPAWLLARRKAEAEAKKAEIEKKKKEAKVFQRRKSIAEIDSVDVLGIAEKEAAADAKADGAAMMTWQALRWVGRTSYRPVMQPMCRAALRWHGPQAQARNDAEDAWRVNNRGGRRLSVLALEMMAAHRQQNSEETREQRAIAEVPAKLLSLFAFSQIFGLLRTHVQVSWPDLISSFDILRHFGVLYFDFGTTNDGFSKHVVELRDKADRTVGVTNRTRAWQDVESAEFEDSIRQQLTLGLRVGIFLSLCALVVLLFRSWNMKDKESTIVENRSKEWAALRYYLQHMRGTARGCHVNDIRRMRIRTAQFVALALALIVGAAMANENTSRHHSLDGFVEATAISALSFVVVTIFVAVCGAFIVYMDPEVAYRGHRDEAIRLSRRARKLMHTAKRRGLVTAQVRLRRRLHSELRGTKTRLETQGMQSGGDDNDNELVTLEWARWREVYMLRWFGSLISCGVGISRDDEEPELSKDDNESSSEEENYNEDKEVAGALAMIRNNGLSVGVKMPPKASKPPPPPLWRRVLLCGFGDSHAKALVRKRKAEQQAARRRRLRRKRERQRGPSGFVRGSIKLFQLIAFSLSLLVLSLGIGQIPKTPIVVPLVLTTFVCVGWILTNVVVYISVLMFDYYETYVVPGSQIIQHIVRFKSIVLLVLISVVVLPASVTVISPISNPCFYNAMGTGPTNCTAINVTMLGQLERPIIYQLSSAESSRLFTEATNLDNYANNRFEEGYLKTGEKVKQSAKAAWELTNETHKPVQGLDSFAFADLNGDGEDEMYGVLARDGSGTYHNATPVPFEYGVVMALRRIGWAEEGGDKIDKESFTDAEWYGRDDAKMSTLRRRRPLYQRIGDPGGTLGTFDFGDKHLAVSGFDQGWRATNYTRPPASIAAQSENPFGALGVLQAGHEQVTICFGDMDGDGDYDAIVSSRSRFSGIHISYIRNVGNSTSPLLHLERQTSNNPFVHINEGVKMWKGAVYPWLVDLNGDSKLDVVLGGNGGFVHVWLNKGTLDVPSFSVAPDDTYREEIGLNSVNMRDSTAIPSFSDVDHDGDMDMYVTNSLGRLLQCENIGDRFTAKFVKCVLPEENSWYTDDTDQRHQAPPLLADVRADTLTEDVTNDERRLAQGIFAGVPFERLSQRATVRVVLSDIDRNGEHDAMIAGQYGLYHMLDWGGKSSYPFRPEIPVPRELGLGPPVPACLARQRLSDCGASAGLASAGQDAGSGWFGVFGWIMGLFAVPLCAFGVPGLLYVALRISLVATKLDWRWSQKHVDLNRQILGNDGGDSGADGAAEFTKETMGEAYSRLVDRAHREDSQIRFLPHVGVPDGKQAWMQDEDKVGEERDDPTEGENEFDVESTRALCRLARKSFVCRVAIRMLGVPFIDGQTRAQRVYVLEAKPLLWWSAMFVQKWQMWPAMQLWWRVILGLVIMMLRPSERGGAVAQSTFTFVALGLWFIVTAYASPYTLQKCNVAEIMLLFANTFNAGIGLCLASNLFSTEASRTLLALLMFIVNSLAVSSVIFSTDVAALVNYALKRHRALLDEQASMYLFKIVKRGRLDLLRMWNKMIPCSSKAATNDPSEELIISDALERTARHYHTTVLSPMTPLGDSMLHAAVTHNQPKIAAYLLDLDHMFNSCQLMQLVNKRKETVVDIALLAQCRAWESEHSFEVAARVQRTWKERAAAMDDAMGIQHRWDDDTDEHGFKHKHQDRASILAQQRTDKTTRSRAWGEMLGLFEHCELEFVYMKKQAVDIYRKRLLTNDGVDMLPLRTVSASAFYMHDLDLSGVHLGDQGAHVIAAMFQPRARTRIWLGAIVPDDPDVAGGEHTIGSAGAAQGTGKNLRRLKLVGCNIGPEGKRVIAESLLGGISDGLTSFDANGEEVLAWTLAGRPESTAAFERTLPKRCERSLVSFATDTWSIDAEQTYLDLSGRGIDFALEDGMLLAGVLCSNSSLTAIDIHGNELCKPTVNQDVGDVKPSTKAALEAARKRAANEIATGQAALVALCGALRGHRAMSSLNLRATGIADDGCLALGSLLRSRACGITDLDISENEFRPSAAAALCDTLVHGVAVALDALSLNKSSSDRKKSAIATHKKTPVIDVPLAFLDISCNMLVSREHMVRSQMRATSRGRKEKDPTAYMSGSLALSRLMGASSALQRVRAHNTSLGGHADKRVMRQLGQALDVRPSLPPPPEAALQHSAASQAVTNVHVPEAISIFEVPCGMHTLELSSCDLTATDAVQLANGIAGAAKLRDLQLQHNRLGMGSQKGVIALAEALGSAQCGITSLNLSDTVLCGTVYTGNIYDAGRPGADSGTACAGVFDPHGIAALCDALAKRNELARESELCQARQEAEHRMNNTKQNEPTKTVIALESLDLSNNRLKVQGMRHVAKMVRRCGGRLRELRLRHVALCIAHHSPDEEAEVDRASKAKRRWSQVRAQVKMVSVFGGSIASALGGTKGLATPQINTTILHRLQNNDGNGSEGGKRKVGFFYETFDLAGLQALLNAIVQRYHVMHSHALALKKIRRQKRQFGFESTARQRRAASIVAQSFAETGNVSLLRRSSITHVQSKADIDNHNTFDGMNGVTWEWQDADLESPEEIEMRRREEEYKRKQAEVQTKMKAKQAAAAAIPGVFLCDNAIFQEAERWQQQAMCTGVKSLDVKKLLKECARLRRRGELGAGYGLALDLSSNLLGAVGAEAISSTLLMHSEDKKGMSKQSSESKSLAAVRTTRVRTTVKFGNLVDDDDDEDDDDDDEDDDDDDDDDKNNGIVGGINNINNNAGSSKDEASNMNGLRSAGNSLSRAPIRNGAGRPPSLLSLDLRRCDIGREGGDLILQALLNKPAKAKQLVHQASFAAKRIVGMGALGLPVARGKGIGGGASALVAENGQDGGVTSALSGFAMLEMSCGLPLAEMFAGRLTELELHASQLGIAEATMLAGLLSGSQQDEVQEEDQTGHVDENVGSSLKSKRLRLRRLALTCNEICGVCVTIATAGRSTGTSNGLEGTLADKSLHALAVSEEAASGALTEEELSVRRSSVNDWLDGGAAKAATELNNKHIASQPWLDPASLPGHSLAGVRVLVMASAHAPSLKEVDLRCNGLGAAGAELLLGGGVTHSTRSNQHHSRGVAMASKANRRRSRITEKQLKDAMQSVSPKNLRGGLEIINGVPVAKLRRNEIVVLNLAASGLEEAEGMLLASVLRSGCRNLRDLDYRSNAIGIEAGTELTKVLLPTLYDDETSEEIAQAEEDEALAALLRAPGTKNKMKKSGNASRIERIMKREERAKELAQREVPWHSICGLPIAMMRDEQDKVRVINAQGHPGQRLRPEGAILVARCFERFTGLRHWVRAINLQDNALCGGDGVTERAVNDNKHGNRHLDADSDTRIEEFEEDDRVWLSKPAPPGGWPERASELCEARGVLKLMDVLKPAYKKPEMNKSEQELRESLGIVEKKAVKKKDILSLINLRRNNINEETQNRLEMRFGEGIVRLLEPKNKHAVKKKKRKT